MLTVSPSGISDDYTGYLADADHIDVGQPVTGTIDYAGDIDIFRFTAQQGNTYQFDMEVLGTLKAVTLRLQDANSVLLASDLHILDPETSRSIWEAPATGDFYVVVAGQNDVVGSYILTVSPAA